MRFHGSTRAGFTLLELVVVVTILTLLAALVLPLAKNMLDSSKANRIAASVEEIRQACSRYWHDMDSFATEDSGIADELMSQADKHQLTMKPSSTDWKGPYLGQPLKLADNPFKDRVVVLPTLGIAGWTGGPFGVAEGFQFFQSLPANTGPGNHIEYFGVTSTVAGLVDQMMDPLISSDPTAWMQYGRVKYDETNKRLCIYLLEDTK